MAVRVIVGRLLSSRCPTLAIIHSRRTEIISDSRPSPNWTMDGIDCSKKMKPPNVAFHGADDHEVIRSALVKCLNADRYAFVRLDETAIRRRDPWTDNVELVVICGNSTRLSSDTLEAFREHWLRGGKFIDVSASLDLIVRLLGGRSPIGVVQVPSSSASVLLMTSSDDECQVPVHLHLNKRISCIREEHAETAKLRIAIKTNDGPSVVVGTVSADGSGGVALFIQARFDADTVESSLTFWRHLLTSRLRLDCSQTASTARTTPSYLITSSKERFQTFQRLFLASGDIRKGSKLFVVGMSDSDGADEGRIPFVVSCQGDSVLGFDRNTYFRHLNTRELGHVVIFGAILPSTMDIISSSVAPHGVVIIAGRQTSGRGRSDHDWLSPEGCAMFSLHVRIPLKSEIGRRPSFVQHLAAMAAVQGIRTMPGYENLNIRLKWPNDIYYGSSVKIGGLVVQSTLVDDTLHCNIGCGLNVSNGSPTVCVNDVIRAEYPSLAQLTPEVSIARTLTRLERLLDDFESKGVDAILHRYYDLWLHEHAQVNVSFPGDGTVSMKRAVVRGLDGDGFLVVQPEGQEGTLYSVQPDGNSFDMLHNLVIVRSIAASIKPPSGH